MGGNGLFQGQLQALFQQFRVENDRDFGVLADEDATLGGMPNIGQGVVGERQGERVGGVVFGVPKPSLRVLMTWMLRLGSGRMMRWLVMSTGM